MKKKIELIHPNTRQKTIDDLLIFDAKCLDIDTKHQLLQLFPELEYVGRLWREIYDETGCIACGRKDGRYCSGGLCQKCYSPLHAKILRKYREHRLSRQTPEDFAAALTLASDAAQKLLGEG